MIVLLLYGLIFYTAVDKLLFLVPAAFLLGAMGEFLSMAAHDILHGSVFKSKRFSIFFCLFISLINLISPSFWKFWHNFHHASVDRWTKDHRPYEFGYETAGYPLMRRLLGPLELFFYKAFHLVKTQIRFVFDRRYKSDRHKKLKFFVFLQCILILSVKVLLFLNLSFTSWLFLEMIPLLIQNFLSNIFLMTQHSYKLDKGRSVRTFSVSLPRWLEVYSLHLGYHVEHHLLPNLPSRHLPYLRHVLQEKFQEIPIEIIPMGEALKEIYKD